MVAINNVMQLSTIQAVQPKKEDLSKKTKKDISTTTEALVGTGLAALAAVGIYIATKGRSKGGNVKPQELMEQLNVSKLEELKQHASVLRDKICNEYQEKLSKFMPIEDIGNLITQDAFKCAGKTKITCSKDFDRAKDYIIHLHENDGPHRDFYLPAKQLKNKISNDIKTQLSELQKDSDWVELRKIRKNLFKQKKTMTKENRSIIESHIDLIDNILLSKTSKDSSTVTLFEEFFGMSLKDASKLAKKTSKEVFDNVDYHSNNRPFDTTRISKRKLELCDFFKQEVREWTHADDTVKRVECGLKNFDIQKQDFQKFQRALAQEMRQSDDVKALKELNKQIAELYKQSSK